MRGRICSRLLFLSFVLVFSMLFCVVGVSAWGAECWQNSSGMGGTEQLCEADGFCRWETDATDLYCDFADGCCMDKGCFQFDATNSSSCTNTSINGGYNCTWDAYMNIWLPNGSFYGTGGCMGDYGTGGEEWGGMSDGCWHSSANKASCTSNTKCSWKANDANQNPWCHIKNLFDAISENSFATSDDVGCCEMRGCYDYDGNETQCLTNTAFLGLCTFVNTTNDPWCHDPVGCCRTKWCSEIENEGNCTKARTDLYMPCEWDVTCVDQGGGGFFFFNDTDSCMEQGGWWNSSGDCQMPSTDGGSGYMFAEDAHCWFADQQINICQNVTGCVYCDDAATELENHTSACYMTTPGACKGHETPWSHWNGSDMLPVGDIATDNLNCTHIQLRSACDYGPLPNCVWQNSSAVTGQYCAPGTSANARAAPPVPFCEHPTSKNNITLCDILAEDYMMPCRWGNVSSNRTASDNCTFNQGAVFGTLGKDQREFEVITSEFSCIAAGGTWEEEYYVEGGALKQEAWCEKGALINLATGTVAANKGTCNEDCMFCMFNVTGGSWRNSSDTVAQGQIKSETACYGSELGYCVWRNDTNSPNSLGWCDYPQEMECGMNGDCHTNCKDCLLNREAYTACLGSIAGCKWVNSTNASGSLLADGDCIAQDKQTCSEDCFSCYSSADCFSSVADCMWDDTNFLCKPENFDGEICFDAVDNDQDGMMDCADPDCSYDTVCGGHSFADCGAVTDLDQCNLTAAFGSWNCTWYNDTWEPIGHCGMPGESCWQWDSDPVTCGTIYGCTNSSNMQFDKTGFCELNTTQMDGAQCWDYYHNESYCFEQTNCAWVNETYPDGSSGGFCDYYMFAQCHNHGDDTACGLDGNCTWHTESWMGAGGGFCEPACFNWTLTESTCGTGDLAGVCEWRNMTDMCMPDVFDMGGGSGGRTGCWQYDGNRELCNLNNYTCVWRNDTAVQNNVSAGNLSGWCNDAGMDDLMGDMKGAPIMLGHDVEDASVDDYVDIDGFGMRVTDKAYGFGMGMYNMSAAALCNGYPINFMVPGSGQENLPAGTGTNTTRFRWYLDTDSNSSVHSHCYATDSGGASCTDQSDAEIALCGYEFYLDYFVENSSTTGTIQTTTKLYACVMNDSSGSQWTWAPTNVFVTDDKKFTCFKSGFGAAFVSVEKEALENFDLFNITAPLRVFAVSFDGAGDGDGADDVGPSYYTPGTVDFAFVDCSDPNTKDPNCKNFQTFGFQTFEDCKNGIDDDSDGLADCADPKCEFTPVCASGTAFDFTSATNDYRAPSVMFSKVDKTADSAIVVFDTDEPANGSLSFYANDSTCITVNTSLNDLGDPNFAFDDYKPFHRVSLDADTLGYALTNSTTYFYKISICDPNTNCGTSACLNFTTKSVNKNFIFKMDVPDGYTVDIPALNYSGNFTYAVGGNSYEVGIKTNSSVTRNINVTVNYSEMNIKFVGVDLYKPKTLDLETAFIADTDNNVLGMNSSSKSWHMLVSDLGLGGANDHLVLDFPVAYSTDNTMQWCDDDLSDCSDVDDYLTCASGGAGTLCDVPTSLGFSAYQVSVPGGNGGTTGGGGGGGTPTTPTNETEEATDETTTVTEDDGEPSGESGAEGVGADVGEGLELPAESAGLWWIWIVIGVVAVVLVVATTLIIRRNKNL